MGNDVEKLNLIAVHKLIPQKTKFNTLHYRVHLPHKVIPLLKITDKTQARILVNLEERTIVLQLEEKE